MLVKVIIINYFFIMFHSRKCRSDFEHKILYVNVSNIEVTLKENIFLLICGAFCSIGNVKCLIINVVSYMYMGLFAVNNLVFLFH